MLRNGRFGRGTQEDSHEVMRALLSALREEEIEVHIKDYPISLFVAIQLYIYAHKIFVLSPYQINMLQY